MFVTEPLLDWLTALAKAFVGANAIGKRQM
jgi:hypothetical protein